MICPQRPPCTCDFAGPASLQSPALPHVSPGPGGPNNQSESNESITVIPLPSDVTSNFIFIFVFIMSIFVFIVFPGYLQDATNATAKSTPAAAGNPPWVLHRAAVPGPS